MAPDELRQYIADLRASIEGEPLIVRLAKEDALESLDNLLATKILKRERATNVVVLVAIGLMLFASGCLVGFRVLQ